MIYTICNIEKEKNKRINNYHQNHPIPTRNKMAPWLHLRFLIPKNYHLHQYSRHRIRNSDSIPLPAQPRHHIRDISYYHHLNINQDQTKHAKDYSNNLID